MSHIYIMSPHNNRGSYVSPSANWKCIFSKTQKTSTRRRQLIHIKRTTNKHKNISNKEKKEMQNEKQQRITLQMMHMSARFNLYCFFLGEPISIGAIGDDCPLTTCDILSGCGLEQEGRGMKVETVKALSLNLTLSILEQDHLRGRFQILESLPAKSLIFS